MIFDPFATSWFLVKSWLVVRSLTPTYLYSERVFIQRCTTRRNRIIGESSRERDFYDFSNKGYLPLGNKTFHLRLFKLSEREFYRERRALLINARCFVDAEKRCFKFDNEWSVKWNLEIVLLNCRRMTRFVLTFVARRVKEWSSLSHKNFPRRRRNKAKITDSREKMERALVCSPL